MGKGGRKFSSLITARDFNVDIFLSGYFTLCGKADFNHQSTSFKDQIQKAKVSN